MAPTTIGVHFLKQMIDLKFSGQESEYDHWRTSAVAIMNLYEFPTIDLLTLSNRLDSTKDRQLYNVLISNCNNLALSIVKRIPDQGKVAWYALEEHYAPTTGPTVASLFIDLIELSYDSLTTYQAKFTHIVTRLSQSNLIIPEILLVQILLKAFSKASTDQSILLKYAGDTQARTDTIFKDLTASDRFLPATILSRAIVTKTPVTTNTPSTQPLNSCIMCSTSTHSTEKCYFIKSIAKYVTNTANRNSLKLLVGFQSPRSTLSTQKKDPSKLLMIKTTTQISSSTSNSQAFLVDSCSTEHHVDYQFKEFLISPTMINSTIIGFDGQPSLMTISGSLILYFPDNHTG